MTQLQNRRRILQFGGAAGAMAAGLVWPGAAFGKAKKAKGEAEMAITPDQALERLRIGNADFAKGHPDRPNLSHQRVAQLATSQKPIAVIVTCSDSRVAPELVFGVGLGEVFVLRDAGNTIDDVMTGSIEYAVAELGAPLIVVMGHERCGAVKAAIEAQRDHTPLPGHIHFATDPIWPAIPTWPVADIVDETVRENVRRMVRQLRSAEPILPKALAEGRLKIIGARYDLDDGLVDFTII